MKCESSNDIINTQFLSVGTVSFIIPALSCSELTHALSLTRSNLTSVVIPPFSVIEKVVSSLTVAHYLGGSCVMLE